MLNEAAGWIEAAAEGSTFPERLAALRKVLCNAGHGSVDRSVWLHLCGEAAWQHQVDRLRRRIATAVTRHELLVQYPLLGVPFAVKDNIDIAGEPTTAACPAFVRTAERDATVVHRLLDAGAIWVGKTNMDQFATGLVGTRSPYGQAPCRTDIARVSGGSSSGSAIAVARGWVPFALGTDTAGSGRIPAAFNGLVGLKPTPGRVSTAGVLPACRTLDCVSILANTVGDARRVLAVIEGADDLDPYSRSIRGAAFASPTVRAGIPRDPRFFGDAHYASAWESALAGARELGWHTVDLDFSLLDEVAALLYDGPWVAERHTVLQSILERDPLALDESVRRVVSGALRFSATDTFRALYRLQTLRAQLRSVWAQVDVLLVPSAPGHPRFDDVARDPLGENARLGKFTNFVNLLGWCALALPAGQTSAGLDFGITLIGPEGADLVLLDLGRRWERPPPALQSPLAPVPVGPNPAPEPWLPPVPEGPHPVSEPSLPLAVVGAHLSGMPLNWQLLERGAHLLRATSTAPRYRLHALEARAPPKPGLCRVPEGEEGFAIAVEIWSMPITLVGSFLTLIPAPLGLGTLEIEDGTQVHGFLCEPHALVGAPDISAYGGWRAYLGAGPPPSGPAPPP